MLEALCTHAWLAETLAAEVRQEPMDGDIRRELRLENLMVHKLSHQLRLGKVGLPRHHQAVESIRGQGAPRRRLWAVPRSDETPTVS